MNSISKAKEIKFIPDYEPGFQYEFSIADFVPYKEKSLGETTPLLKGDQAPYFTIEKGSGVWQDIFSKFNKAEIVSLDELISDKQLVISFYSNQWGEYGKLHLEVLERAHAKIQGLGGNLIVICPDHLHEIQNLIEKFDFSFSIINDTDNQIASQFGIYSDIYPLWQRISGIEYNTSLPSTFVISQDYSIAYNFTNENFDSIFSVKDVLTAVYSIRDIKQTA